MENDSRHVMFFFDSNRMLLLARKELNHTDGGQFDAISEEGRTE